MSVEFLVRRPIKTGFQCEGCDQAHKIGERFTCEMPGCRLNGVLVTRVGLVLPEPAAVPGGGEPEAAEAEPEGEPDQPPRRRRRGA